VCRSFLLKAGDRLEVWRHRARGSTGQRSTPDGFLSVAFRKFRLKILFLFLDRSPYAKDFLAFFILVYVGRKVFLNSNRFVGKEQQNPLPTTG
jgi:hypothetical protein